MLGGRTKARTWDPMSCKSSRFINLRTAALRHKRPFPQSRIVTQTKQVPDPFVEPRRRSLHSRHRGAAAERSPLIGEEVRELRKGLHE
jgi:hypothetical protein